MSQKDSSWVDRIKEVPDWIKGSIAFVAALVAFILLWRENPDLLPQVLLATGAIGGIAACIYILLKRDEPRIARSTQGPFRYSKKQRYVAVAGLTVIILALTGIGIHSYIQNRPTDEVIILVAEFDGPRSEYYRVTETVLANLRNVVKDYDDIQIMALEYPITESMGPDIARTEGKNAEATIVIWGWYGLTEENVLLSLHFEILNPPACMPKLESEMEGQVRIMALEYLQSVDLQIELANELSFLSLLTVAMGEYTAGDWESSLEHLDDAIDHISDDTSSINRYQAYSFRGCASQAMGNLTNAVAAYSKAIEFDIDNGLAHNNRGVAQAKLGNLSAASEDFQKALGLNSGEFSTYVNLGNVYLLQDKPQDALFWYEQSVQKAPKNPLPYYSRGNAYYNLGNLEAALVDLDKAIEFDEDFSNAYLLRGQIHDSLDNFPAAISDFDKVLELETDNAFAYASRGIVFGSRKYIEEALSDFNKAIDLDPELALAYYGRGLVYLDLGDVPSALNNFRRFLELHPDDEYREFAEEIILKLEEQNEIP